MRLRALKNRFIFNNYDKSILRKIEDYIEKVDSMPKEFYKNNEIFKEDSFLYSDKRKLCEHIEKDIIYQENIAKKIIKNSKIENLKTKFISYHWICELDQIENKNYLSIAIIIEPENELLGDIGFPIMIVLTEKNEFRYWEIIHIDFAMKSIRDIYGIDLENTN